MRRMVRGLHTLVKLDDILGVLVRAEQVVPVHEEVAVVEHVQAVVYMVVSRRAETEGTEDPIPWCRYSAWMSVSQLAYILPNAM